MILTAKIKLYNKQDVNNPHESWTYSQAELTLVRTLDEQKILHINEHLKQGIINWGNSQVINDKALTKLSLQAAPKILAKIIKFSQAKHIIQLIIKTSNQQQLHLIEGELIRLTRQKHFQIKTNPVILNFMLKTNIKSTMGLLNLKHLLLNSFKSIGLNTQIYTAKNIIIITII